MPKINEVAVFDKKSGKYYKQGSRVGEIETYGGINNAAFYPISDISGLTGGLMNNEGCDEIIVKIDDCGKIVEM